MHRYSGLVYPHSFFPLREGSVCKEETAAIRKVEIEHDILARHGLPRAGAEDAGREAGTAKLNFQVPGRTMATLAETKGGVKDVQGVLGHSKADTTVNVYMQQIEAGVKSTLDAIYSELTARVEVAASS